MPKAEVAVINTPDLAKTKAAAKKEAEPLIMRANALSVTTQQEYVEADTIRDTLKSGSKKWSDRLQLIIKPAYDALQGLYALKNEVVGPMDEAAKIVTAKMQAYKREEARLIAEARQKEEELRLKEEMVRQRLAMAKSMPATRLVGRLLYKVREEIEEVIAERVAPVTVTQSGTRTVLKWKVGSMRDLCKAVAAGEIPEDVVMINSPVMNDYFNGDDENKSAIRTWPGIETYEDVQIVSKRGR